MFYRVSSGGETSCDSPQDSNIHKCTAKNRSDDENQFCAARLSLGLAVMIILLLNMLIYTISGQMRQMRGADWKVSSAGCHNS